MKHICICIQSSGILIDDEIIHFDATWSDGEKNELRVNWNAGDALQKEEVLTDFFNAIEGCEIVDYDLMSFRFLQIELSRLGIKPKLNVRHLQKDVFDRFPNRSDYSLDAVLRYCKIEPTDGETGSEKTAKLLSFFKS